MKIPVVKDYFGSPRSARASCTTSTATFAAGRYGLIKDNVFHTTKICASDATNKVYVINNRGITGNAKGSGGAGAFVCNAAFAQDNRFSASDANNVVHPAEGAIA